MAYWIEWLLEAGMDEHCERGSRLSAENQAPCGRAGYDLSRLLLRQCRTWFARSSGGMAKERMAKAGMLKRVQLTISGCVGRCDVPNVVVITSASGTEWLGNIVKFDQYRSLLEWAVRCRDAGEMLALPREFRECRIIPFRS